MSFTGGISFYDKSLALLDDGASVTASSGDAESNLMIGTNKYFKWVSSGSDDTTTETITITLDAAQDITRIFLIDHNWKQYTVKYGASVDFTNVTGIDGALGGGITETAYARDTSYYEFDSVNTDTIVITVTKTQVVDAEKNIAQVIPTTEIGTLIGYPKLNNVDLDRNAKKEKAVSGRMHIEKGFEGASFDLSLKRYPNQADINILDGLHDRNLPFLVWLSGGLPDQFTLEQRGFRLKDVYQMQTDRPARNSYDKNVYLIGVNQSYSFEEVVN